MMPSISSRFCNKFCNIRAQNLDSIYHKYDAKIIFKSCFLGREKLRFLPYKCDFVTDVFTLRY